MRSARVTTSITTKVAIAGWARRLMIRTINQTAAALSAKAVICNSMKVVSSPIPGFYAAGVRRGNGDFAVEIADDVERAVEQWLNQRIHFDPVAPPYPGSLPVRYLGYNSRRAGLGLHFVRQANLRRSGIVLLSRDIHACQTVIFKAPRAPPNLQSRNVPIGAASVEIEGDASETSGMRQDAASTMENATPRSPGDRSVGDSC